MTAALLTRPKHEPYRDRDLLDLCHEIHECQIGVPGVCIGYSSEGCVPCHLPKTLFDGGGAMKSSDLAAAGCNPCHMECDQGKRLSRDDRRFYLMRGAIRTALLFLKFRWLVVAERR